MSQVVQYDLQHALSEIRHLLPIQGPIEVFIHHNTLHSFENLDFEDAVENAATVYGAKPYLEESSYRELYLKGTIKQQDLDLELAPYLNDDSDLIAGVVSRSQFRQALVLNGLSSEDEMVARWKQSESRLRLRSDLSEKKRRSLVEQARNWLIGLNGAGFEDRVEEFGKLNSVSSEISRRDLEQFIRAEDDSKRSRRLGETVTASLLWALAGDAVAQLNVPVQPLAIHHQQALKLITGVDIYEQVNQLLIQLCSIFVDQGVSYWPMPGRDLGFIAATENLISRKGIPTAPWIKRVEKLFAELRPTALGAAKTLDIVLTRLGVNPSQVQQYLAHSCLSLKGWAGFIALLEKKPEVARDRPVRAAFDEFVAVQNLLLLAAVEDVVVQAGLHTLALPTLARFARRKSASKFSASALSSMRQTLFESCQITGIGPNILAEQGATLATQIMSEVSSFTGIVRRRIWHLAYERSFLNSVLQAFKNHKPNTEKNSQAPQAQIMFCIDEREESIRRHLEEINPAIETLGYPGFFSLPLAYQGMHHLHPEALCPVVLEPTIAVSELDASSTGRSQGNLLQRCMGYLSRELRNITQTPLGGSLLATTLGHLALIPFSLRVLQPALAGRVHSVFHDTDAKAPSFDVRPANKNLTQQDLKKSIVAGLSTVFHTTGIAQCKSRLVVIMGHGSSSLNNPHESAHDCGACGGRRGAPSARLFARFANQADIREQLNAAGVNLAADTFVLGAYHDTCDDTITIFDEHLVPETHRDLVASVVRDCRNASARNALERSRRFLSSTSELTPHAAAEAMLRRAEDFSQPRPEYGHATNALAFVGRRSRCRGLFLDRRAFLSSYDAAQDISGAALKALISAVVPVCAGINLEYYFSLIDSTNYGCGTKLPHNIVGQIGVMDGAASDLRTGLPWQMVEIHEPVRLVMLVEATPDRLQEILNNLPSVRNLIERRWLWFVAVEPSQEKFWIYSAGQFAEVEVAEQALPIINDSLSYCAKTTQPLPFATVAKFSAQTNLNPGAYGN